MLEITKKSDALRLIKNGEIKLVDCNERHQKDKDVVLAAVKIDGTEIDYAYLSDIENETEVKAENTFLFEAIKVANLTTPYAVDVFKETINHYTFRVDNYIKETFKQLSPQKRKEIVKKYQNRFDTELAIAYAKQKPLEVIKSAIETEKNKKARKVEKPEVKITRKTDAIKCIKAGKLKLSDCMYKHRKDEEVVLAAVKVDGAEINDAYLDDMENETEVNAKNTFLMKAIPYAKLDTKNAVAIFDSIINIYAQDKDSYIKSTFKLETSERRKMITNYENELKTELAVSYAKQKPLAVIKGAIGDTGINNEKTLNL